MTRPRATLWRVGALTRHDAHALRGRTRRNSTLLVLAALAVQVAVVATVSLRAEQNALTPEAPVTSALPPNASGEDIFRAACASCHAPDGRGAQQSVVGFALPLPNGHDFPDFTDCPTNTVEPQADWAAVVARGGPIRGLDRHMPAFGDALSSAQIDAVIGYLWSLCTDSAWPRGDLNLPRAFFTEKAFPENEAVLTSGIVAKGAHALSNELVYEKRIGARGTFEMDIPFGAQQVAAGGAWHRGLGDIEVSVRRTLVADVSHGSILAAGGALTLPTGKESLGLGNGFTVYEPFAMWGQMVGANGFVQMHTGYEIPSDHSRGQNEAFLRTALGYTFAQDHGIGRAWTPMTELIVAKSTGATAQWDIVPQMQISLSKLQHVLMNVGVRVPVTQREGRTTQVLTYVLWDWFDGGLFEFWR